MANRQQQAKLRTCASCEWVFKWQDEKCDCPKCGFASYGARWVYGDKAYTYQRTQEPWKAKKMQSYEFKLNQEIRRHKMPNMYGVKKPIHLEQWRVASS